MNRIYTVCLLLLFVGNCFAQQDTTVAEHYVSNGSNCAIFPASYIDIIVGLGKRFTPTHADVDKAKIALSTQLKNLKEDHNNQIEDKEDIVEHLKKYSYQYFGYTDSLGHRILYINALRWETGDRKSFEKQFLNSWFDVMDGGDYFWNIRYDIDADKLFDIEVNGMG